MKPNCITYHLDHTGQITYLSDDWDSEAIAGEIGNLKATDIIHRSIFDFIADGDCLRIYKILIDRVQQDNLTLKFPYRCDAPQLRRYMEMEVFPTEAGTTGFKSCTLREEPRDPVILLDDSVQKSDQFVTICSWCMKIKTGDQQWLEAEQAIRHLGLFEQAPTPQLTHGICPACYENMMKDFEK